MRALAAGDGVVHDDYGPGTILELLGENAVVEFYGERIDVKVGDLVRKGGYTPDVVENESSKHEKFSAEARRSLRKAYEALNLGIVPPGTEELFALTIDGGRIASDLQRGFDNFSVEGLCQVVFGNYGSGKTHYLKLVCAAARKAGWVTAFVEFDPKAADPAKPHLVYRELMNSLAFPSREDGSVCSGFLDLVKDARNHWDAVVSGKWYRKSPWFKSLLPVLKQRAHDEADREYVDACRWLAGEPVPLPTVRRFATSVDRRSHTIPKMPRQKETADIYAFHLVVVSEICRAAGYKGLVVVLDEAEHVRGFNVRRRERANNFFDVLARCAHTPLLGEAAPIGNEHEFDVPSYWSTGPHFALFVGLTEGDTFTDHELSLREACVFLHREEDKVVLAPPSPKDYEEWCKHFLTRCGDHFPAVAGFASTPGAVGRVAGALRKEFEDTPAPERVLRIWTKLASLAPSVLMARNSSTEEELLSTLRTSAQEAAGNVLPWDN